MEHNVYLNRADVLVVGRVTYVGGLLTSLLSLADRREGAPDIGHVT